MFFAFFFYDLSRIVSKRHRRTEQYTSNGKYTLHFYTLKARASTTWRAKAKNFPSAVAQHKEVYYNTIIVFFFISK